MADADAAGVHEAVSPRNAAVLTDAVREAGALALSMFRTELKNWIKGASSPVSEADIAANDLLERKLRAATPDYGWLSEESADDESRLGKRLVLAQLLAVFLDGPHSDAQRLVRRETVAGHAVANLFAAEASQFRERRRGGGPLPDRLGGLLGRSDFRSHRLHGRH